jgi:hypothetical protein
MIIFMTTALNINAITKEMGALEDLTVAEKAKAMYQPGTIVTQTKHIFSWLTANSVIYQQSEFKYYKGGYFAVYDEICAEALKHRPDLGVVKPARVDMHAIEKSHDCKALQPFKSLTMLDDATESGYNNLMDTIAVNLV